jgi:lysozyme
MRVDGVDISHHQRNIQIDWAKLKGAGVKWMYHKATEGTTVQDVMYHKRRAEAKAARMPFGAYHFARPEKGDARLEARAFIGFAQPKLGDLRPCLDLETTEHLSGAALVQWADDFCDEVFKRTGFMPVVYTPYELSDELEKKALFWVPRYNDSNTPPVRRWDIWQFSNGQLGVPDSVPGLGHVDLNHSKVGLRRLRMTRRAATRAKLRKELAALRARIAVVKAKLAKLD